METGLPEGLRGRVLALVLSATVVAAAWTGGVRPLMDWYAARGEMLQQRHMLLQRMQALAATLPDLQRQSSGEHTSDAALLEGASDAIAGAALQSSVQRLAATAGAALNSMEMLPAEPRDSYRRIALRVATAAPWPVLIALLQAIDQGSRHMLIDDLQLRASPFETRAESSSVSAAFTVLAFRPNASRAGR